MAGRAEKTYSVSASELQNSLFEFPDMMRLTRDQYRLIMLEAPDNLHWIAWYPSDDAWRFLYRMRDREDDRSHGRILWAEMLGAYSSQCPITLFDHDLEYIEDFTNHKVWSLFIPYLEITGYTLDYRPVDPRLQKVWMLLKLGNG